MTSSPRIGLWTCTAMYCAASCAMRSVVTIQPITEDTAIRYMMTAVTMTDSFMQSISPRTLSPP